MLFITKKISILGVAALIIGGTAAFTTSKSESVLIKYGYDQSTSMWEDVTGLQQSDPNTTRDYRCDESSNTCTAEFPEDVNPNDQANDSHPGVVSPTNIQEGDFSLE